MTKGKRKRMQRNRLRAKGKQADALFDVMRGRASRHGYGKGGVR